MGNFDMYIETYSRPCEESITDVLRAGSDDSYVFVAPEVID